MFIYNPSKTNWGFTACTYVAIVDHEVLNLETIFSLSIPKAP